MRSRVRTAARAVVVATVLLGVGAATAGAASVNVTGDDDAPLGIAPGTTAVIRTMDPTVQIQSPGWFTASIAAADGSVIDSVGCSISSRTRFPEYRGNQTYTVSVTEFTDFRCDTPTGSAQFAYRINAGVTLPPPPARPHLTRRAGSFSSRPLFLSITPNPNSSTEIIYARNATVAADGSLRGTLRRAYLNTDTNRAELTFPVPGTYTVVARATRGTANSPWSAPMRIRTVGPFDLRTVSFIDSTGPSYALRASVRETLARGGLVRISIAGSSGAFRSIGSARVARNGSFSHRFTQNSAGVYRIRYAFAGNTFVVRGQEIERIRIYRRVVFG
jgi:hypothetical protein